MMKSRRSKAHSSSNMDVDLTGHGEMYDHDLGDLTSSDGSHMMIDNDLFEKVRDRSFSVFVLIPLNRGCGDCRWFQIKSFSMFSAICSTSMSFVSEPAGQS